jgi:tripartite-type tricarboxylate transporter receptor subunit TctC
MTPHPFPSTFTSVCLAAALAATAAHAQGKTYPDKPVSIICDAGAGSTPDVVARFVAEGLGRIWGQQGVVLDRPGANGSIAAHAALEAAPDGYTLYIPALSSFVAQPNTAPKIPLDVKELAPIGFAAENPMFIAVSPRLGVKTLPELLALAKQRPGKISYAVSGVGRLTHMAGELLQMRTGVKLLMVPYTSGPAMAVSDIGGGRVDTIIEGYSGIAGAIKSGLVIPIAVATLQRLPEFPDLPTVAETVPGYAATGWQIMAAQAGTPEAIVQKVSQDLAKVVSDPELKKKLGNLGSYTRVMTAAEAKAFVEGEQKTWQPVLKQIAASAQ